MLREMYKLNKEKYKYIDNNTIKGGMLIIGHNKFPLKYIVGQDGKLNYIENVGKNYSRHPISQEEHIYIENFLYFILPFVTMRNAYLSISSIKNFAYIGCGYNGMIFSTSASDGTKIIIKIISTFNVHFPENPAGDIIGYSMITNNGAIQNIPQMLCRVYGGFYTEDNTCGIKYKMFHPNIINFNENVDEIQKIHPFLDVHNYVITEATDGDITLLYPIVSKIKKTNYTKWVDALLKCINDIVSAFIFLQTECKDSANKIPQFGLCHLDVKPENIAFCTNNADDIDKYTFKLIDYGSVRKYEYGKDIDSKFAGSPTYALFSTQNTSIFRDYYCLLLSVCEIFNVFDNTFDINPDTRDQRLTDINDEIEMTESGMKSIEIFIPDNPNNKQNTNELRHKLGLLVLSLNLVNTYENSGYCANYVDVIKYHELFNRIET